MNLFLEFIQLNLGHAIASKLGRLLGLIDQINVILDTCIWGLAWGIEHITKLCK